MHYCSVSSLFVDSHEFRGCIQSSRNPSDGNPHRAYRAHWPRAASREGRAGDPHSALLTDCFATGPHQHWPPPLPHHFHLRHLRAYLFSECSHTHFEYFN